MQRNKAATLDRVLHTSVQEFAQKGFHLARVSDIAALARCSTETIYDVYVSKEGLFMAVVQHVFEHHVGGEAVLNALEPQLAAMADPVERAAAVLTAYAAPQADETFIAILYQVMSARSATPPSSIQSLHKRRMRFKKWLKAALDGGIASGAFLVGSVDEASELLCNATGIMLTAKQHFFGAVVEPETPFQAAQKALAAFCTPKGAERLAGMSPPALQVEMGG